MSERPENPFTVRLGRIRSGVSGRHAKSFLSKMTHAMSKAGPKVGRTGAGPSSKVTSGYRRRVIIKASIIKMATSSAGALRAHLSYIQRDSAMHEQDRGKLFNSVSDDVNAQDLTSKIEQDRHHFRFIISPEDGDQMHDLKPFVRDLVSQMEQDLETKLDWAGAIHDDTAHPHAHIVMRGKREDGRDLVLPRAYIAHGMRDRAEGLVTLELGPQTALEAKQKLAHEASALRLTRIDKFLFKKMDEQRRFTLAASPPQWRAVHATRLKMLEQLGLAEKTGRGIWQLSDTVEPTLKSLAERHDIVKTMHRALAGIEGRHLAPDAILSAGDPDGRHHVGAVLAKGVTGEAHDQAYVVVDTVEGHAVYARIGDPAQLADFEKRSVVKLTPPDVSPRSSDRTIASIAGQHGGQYSAGLHQRHDPKASPEFIAAHVRRLENLRRSGLVTRHKDGSWDISGDYLSRVETFQRQQVARQPLTVSVESRLSLSKQSEAIGATWLDRLDPGEAGGFGWGLDVNEAMKTRRAFLRSLGIDADATKPLSQAQRAALVRMDLQQASEDLSGQLGKPYMPMPQRGALEGTYRLSTERPSGRFAVIERGKDFTIVPWRPVMDRNLGMQIRGQVTRSGMSWTLSRAPGLHR